MQKQNETKQPTMILDSSMGSERFEQCVGSGLKERQRKEILYSDDGAELLLDWIIRRFWCEIAAGKLNMAEVRRKCSDSGSPEKFITSLLVELRDLGLGNDSDELIPFIFEGDFGQLEDDEELVFEIMEEDSEDDDEDYEPGQGCVAFSDHSDAFARVDSVESLLDYRQKYTGVDGDYESAYRLYGNDQCFRESYWKNFFLPEGQPVCDDDSAEGSGRQLFEFHKNRIKTLVDPRVFGGECLEDRLVEAHGLDRSIGVFERYLFDYQFVVRFWEAEFSGAFALIHKIVRSCYRVTGEPKRVGKKREKYGAVAKEELLAVVRKHLKG